MYKKLEQTKHFFRMIGYILMTIYKVGKDKRTWAVVAFIVWTYLISFFNANYYTQSPVKTWQRVIVPRYSVKPIKKVSVAVKKPLAEVKAPIVPLTEEEIVKGAKHGEELWNIYMLESTRGKNDGCRKRGEGFAGFGVMSLGTPACYESFEKAVERASYWYTKVREGNTLDEALCIWNLGQKQPQCRYSQKYHTL